jgi:general L-amino acid transport system permease protein
VLALALIFALARPALRWVFSTAEWEVVAVNLRLLLVGQYPAAEIWRAWLALHLLVAVTSLSMGVWGRRWRLALFLLLPAVGAAVPGLPGAARLHLLAMSAVAQAAFALGRYGGHPARRAALSAWVIILPLTLLIIGGAGRSGPFPLVPANLWGGLLLTFVLSIAGIVLSFPLGVLLALGRRSNLPVMRWASIIYIEVIRGLPLVTILFMASNMVPLFLPGGVNLDRVLRALFGMTLFSAAYLAENVRGGLQAIPRGQYEAAHALGLNGLLTMGFIILPQALRLVIPVLVGQFISLFKDTSLVATIGLLDLLGISRSILAQPQYIGSQQEVLVFVTLVYWSISYLMAALSQRMEKALGVGER